MSPPPEHNKGWNSTFQPLFHNDLCIRQDCLFYRCGIVLQDLGHFRSVFYFGVRRALGSANCFGRVVGTVITDANADVNAVVITVVIAVVIAAVIAAAAASRSLGNGEAHIKACRKTVFTADGYCSGMNSDSKPGVRYYGKAACVGNIKMPLTFSAMKT
jgi:hypothetical protein